MKKQRELKFWHLLIFSGFLITVEATAGIGNNIMDAILGKYIEDSYTRFIIILTCLVTFLFIMLILGMIKATAEIVSKYVLQVEPDLKRCPKCDEKNLGINGETNEWYGSLEVKDNLYTRKCHCGFEVTVDVNKGSTKNRINLQILEKLKEPQEDNHVRVN